MVKCTCIIFTAHLFTPMPLGFFIFHHVLPDNFYSVAWTCAHGRFKSMAVGFVSLVDRGSVGVPASDGQDHAR